MGCSVESKRGETQWGKKERVGSDEGLMASVGVRDVAWQQSMCSNTHRA